MPLIRDLLTYPAADGGHVVAAGDPTGHLLWVEGSHPMRTRVEAMGLIEGALWSEAALDAAHAAAPAWGAMSASERG